MTTDSTSRYVQIELEEEGGIEAVVLAFRRNGELHELASVDPPVTATIRQKSSSTDSVTKIQPL